MVNFSTALVYVAFFSLIGAACYFTHSAIPLFALVFTPSTSGKSNG